MFKRAVIALPLLFMTAGIANGQEIQPTPRPTPTPLVTMHGCDTESNYLFELVQNKYGELPLGSSISTIRLINGQWIKVETFWLMNPEKGTYSIIAVFPNGYGCLILNGNNFVPYKNVEKGDPS